MDTGAHRIIKHARDTLVDGFRLSLNDLTRRPGDPWTHALSEDQAVELDRIALALWRVMCDDPAPPECQNCATALFQPTTGRPRRFCSDACRSADARARAAIER
jgi:hypothetical protein